MYRKQLHVRIFLRILMLMLFALSTTVRSLAAELPDDEPDWTKKLFTEALTPAVQDYVRTHPQEAYRIFVKGMQTAKANDAACLLTTFTEVGNSQLLEILDIAMNSPNATIQQTAVFCLKSIAFQEFPRKDAPSDYSHRFAGALNDGGKAYAAWKSQVVGKSPEEAITLVERQLLKAMAQSNDPAERLRSLIRLVSADFHNDTPYGQLRRRVALEGHVIDTLERMCTPPNQASIYSLYGLEVFGADEACLRRAVLPYTGKGNDMFLRSTAISTLAKLRSPMATEIITTLLTKGLEDERESMLVRPIAIETDPKLIPIYIGALETDRFGLLASQMHISLTRMTHEDKIPENDVTGWERWWKQNRDRFPETVRNIPIPRLSQVPHKDAQGVSYPRRLVWREAGNDRNRGYWLVCPKRLLQDKSITINVQKRPGVVVVMPEDGNADKAADYWLDVCTKALDDHYFVAVVDAPHVGTAQTSEWTIGKGKSNASGNSLDVERTVNDIAADVGSQFDVDPLKCFLFGSGESGMATYACALSPETRFHGFFILNSKFQSSKLPPLAYAKGRKFYIQTSPTDSYAPPWQVSAGAALLTKAGAIVKQVSVTGGHNYDFTPDSWQPLHTAIEWLESGR